MKNNTMQTRLHTKRAAAFVSAMLIAFAGTGSFAVQDALNVSAASTQVAYDDGLFLSDDNYVVTTITPDDFAAGISSSMAISAVRSVITTERDKRTGDVGVVVVEYVGWNESDEKTLVIKHSAGSDVIISMNVGGHTMLTRFDEETKKVEYPDTNSTLSEKTNLDLSSALFPAGEGCDSVTIYGNGLNQQTSGGTMHGTTLTYTGDEFASGTEKFSYFNNTVLNAEEYLAQKCRVRFIFGDDYVEYIMIGKYAYLNEDTRKPDELTNSNGDTLDDGNGNTLLDGTDSNGSPVVSDETIIPPEQTEKDMVSVFAGASLIGKMTSAQFAKGTYTIPDYNPETNYYVRVNTDDNKNAVFYKYDHKKGTWVKRIDTRETPEYELSVDWVSLPKEAADGDIGVTDARWENIWNDYDTRAYQTVGSWTAKEYFSGTAKYTIDPTKSYKLTFYSPEKGEEDSVYTLIGIDAERISGSPTYKKYGVDIPLDVPSDGEIVVEGWTEDGNELVVKYTTPNYYDDGDMDDYSTFLPDGEYTITNPKNNLYEDVVIDGDNSEDKEGSISDEGKKTPDGSVEDHHVNLKEPETVSRFTVTSPDRQTTVDSGSLRDGVLDDLSDMNVSGNYLKEFGAYVCFSAENGVANSTAPDAMTKEEGYLYVTDDGKLGKVVPESLLRGDVNMDGEVTVADAVMLQKYLLTTESFGIAQFANADVCTDGDCDVFDLAELKRILLNKTDSAE